MITLLHDPKVRWSIIRWPIIRWPGAHMATSLLGHVATIPAAPWCQLAPNPSIHMWQQSLVEINWCMHQLLLKILYLPIHSKWGLYFSFAIWKTKISEQMRAPCPHVLRTFLENKEQQWSKAPTLNGEVGAERGQNCDFERQKKRH